MLEEAQSTVTVGPAQWVDRIRRAVASSPQAAILESAPGFGSLGRYSIYAPNPRCVFQATGSDWKLTGDWPFAHPPADGDPFEVLRHLLKQTSCPPSAAPFAGGWIGFIGYDVATLLEVLPRSLPRTGLLPDIHLGYFDTFALHDLASQNVQLVTTNRFDEPVTEVRQRAAEFRQSIDAQPAFDASAPVGPLTASVPSSDFSPDEYCWAIEQVLEYIRAGDIFQANFTHRFSAPFTGETHELYNRCRALSPAPFGAFLRHGPWSVVSTSPELFLRVSPNGKVETRPIKGTRPRGNDPIHDLLLREELRSSVKDRAELTMIVDLERNDLGRVCEFGSVRVGRHAHVESYSNVHHLVSSVTGNLRPDCDIVDLLKATFPGGSITGAPKIRAMEIIDSLERCRRGVYTGSIGYFSDNGNVDLNIAIRTLVVEGDTVHYHVGGGIVADSEPLAEYRETLSKGQRMFQALKGS